MHSCATAASLCDAGSVDGAAAFHNRHVSQQRVLLSFQEEVVTLAASGGHYLKHGTEGRGQKCNLYNCLGLIAPK